MILVDVYVPAVDKNYDFELDDAVTIQVILEELTEMIGQKERTTIAGDTSALMLCDRKRRKFLPKELSLRQCGIGNGSSLLIV